MWSVTGDFYFPCDKTEEALPPGQYIPQVDDRRGFYFVKKAVNLDELLVLPDSKTKYVIDSIEDFWGREKNFRKYGFLWKRGIMLWGPPGSGKTSCVQQLSQQIVDKGGISVYCVHPSICADGLRILRRIEPRRQVVVILEDIDSIIESYGEHELLALLDGELQIDNVVFIATTNYPEDLDSRFTQRPSRFDEVIHIDMPNTEARKVYLHTKNPRLRKDENELNRWVKGTDNYPISALKELVVGVECLGRTFDETKDRLDKMMSRRPTSEDGDQIGNPSSKGFGFSPSKDKFVE